MPTQVACGQCGQRFLAADHLAGMQTQCSQCGHVLAIPAAADEDRDYHLASIPAEQWFITLPDGRQLGPASEAQFQAAADRGSIPATAYVRRGDWPHAMPLGSFVAQRQAEVQASRERAAPPTETYGQQFSRNPLGTLLFGPQMPEYRASRDPRVREDRRRVFLRWVYLLGGLAGGAIVLPLLAGLLRLDPPAGALGAGVGLIMSFWPGVFFLIGMLMYAGAHFEWGWFMNSRRMRAMRSGGGDQMARGFYLWSGRIIMSLSTAASAGLTLLTAGMTLVIGWDEALGRRRAAEPPVVISQSRPPAGARRFEPPESDPGRNPLPQVPTIVLDPTLPPRSGSSAARSSEDAIDGAQSDPAEIARAQENVRRARSDLDATLARVTGDRQELARLEELITASPHELALREAAHSVATRVIRGRESVAIGRAAWEQAVIALEAAVLDSGAAPDPVLQQQRLRPPPTDLAPDDLSRFTEMPVKEIGTWERNLMTLESQLEIALKLAGQIGVEYETTIDPGPPKRRGTAREQLLFLAGRIDSIRGQLTTIHERFGYYSPQLQGESAGKRVSNVLSKMARPSVRRTP